MRRTSLALALVALTLACSKHGDAPSKDQAKDAAVAATPEAEAKPGEGESPTDANTSDAKTPDAKADPDAAPPVDPSLATPANDHLLIADGEGLHEYDLEGKLVKTIAAGPASAPRVLADGRVVFLRSTDVGVELWIHGPAETKAIATLPSAWNGDAYKAQLPGPDLAEDLYLQTAGDFRIDASKNQACIRLQDRNDNMVNYGVELRVGLADAKLSQRVSVCVEEGCPAADDLNDSCYANPLELERTPATTAFPFSYESETGTLSGPEGVTTKICAVASGEDDDYRECAGLDARSPSGRYELLSGQRIEGDYIYEEVILLDRESGKLWAILGGDAAKLLEIEASAVYGEHEGWTMLPFEADVRWIAGDRLWLDGLLIDPSKSSLVRVPGDLAFRLDR